MTDKNINNCIRTRFAPSPTGYLHIGNVRTALFNWLFTRKNGGVFVLRIEDTDNVRSREEYFDAIIDDLSRFGLDWDEGPDMGGACGPYKQSQRQNIYEKHLNSLLENDLAYECFCQLEELEIMRKESIKNGQTAMYPGRCAHLTEEEKREFRSQGRKPSIRFRVAQKNIIVKDLIRGDVSFDTATIGDFIIVKSDGGPAFHFAVAVDDGEMQITHVIRGEDHLTNTPKHILIMEALGFTLPQYAHLPMILGDDHQPLSKRHGHVSIRDYLDEGYLPEALMNHLALLGWSAGDNQEIYLCRDLIKKFDLGHIKKGAAIFDTKKLDWIGMQHMKDVSDTRLAQMAIPYLKTEETLDNRRHVTEGKFDYLKKVVHVLRSYLTKIKDINIYADIFLLTQVKYSDDAVEVLEKEDSKKVLDSIVRNFPEDPIDEASFNSLLGVVKKETAIKGRDLFQPIRAALTGRLSGPELKEVFPLLCPDILKKRFEEAQKLVSK